VGPDYNKRQNALFVYETGFILTPIWILMNKIIVFMVLVCIAYITLFSLVLCLQLMA
jgi:hypothetical protein